MRNTLTALAFSALVLSVVGCSNVGGAPEGASAADLKSSIDKMSLEDRAKLSLEAPGPLEQKKAHIEEMYKKEGKEIPADIQKVLGGSATAH